MKVVLVHYQPPEGYPPILNLWNFIKKNNTGCTAWLLTSDKKHKKSGSAEISSEVNDRQRNLITFDDKGNKFVRVIRFFFFHLKSIVYLIRYKPNKIIYFESLSAVGPVFYKKYINNKVDVIAHYHEYTTKNEFKAGSFSFKAGWWYEMKNYHLISYFSHTNPFRLTRFIDDYKLDRNKSLILPNYPPFSWQSKSKKKTGREYPVKILYVGYGLSNTTMYIEELVSWINKQSGKFTLDCYISFMDETTRALLNEYKSDNIKLHTPVPYYQLPDVIKNYDVGVILYRNTTDNYTYNAPNKLFEYHVLGLDVWLPDVLIGSLEFITTNTYPKILPVNFTDLEHFDFQAALNRDNLFEDVKDYSYEKIYDGYLKKIGVPVNTPDLMPHAQ